MSKMDICSKNDNSFQPLNIFEKCSTLDVWQGSEYYPGT